MSQPTPSDQSGRIWAIHMTENYFGMTFRTGSEPMRGENRGENIARVLKRDDDLRQLSFAFLADIHVDRRMEGRGLGSMLLSAVIEACRARGFEGIEGKLSRADSGHFDKLKHFYEKFGFIVTFYPPEHPQHN